MEAKEQFGLNLRRLRLDARLTQIELARLTQMELSNRSGLDMAEISRL